MTSVNELVALLKLLLLHPEMELAVAWAQVQQAG